MRTPSEPMPAWLDRERERAALDGLLGDLRLGRGGALVVRGEAGTGNGAWITAPVPATAQTRQPAPAGPQV
jgi:hypothetical protein